MSHLYNSDKVLKVKVYRTDEVKSKYKLPAYQTLGASAVDLNYVGDDNLIIKPFERVMVPTGLYVEIPCGYEGQVRPRSGLAIKNGLTVINTPGTIDSDYRGEIKVLMVNLSNEEQKIEPGMRIAQLVFVPIIQAQFIEVESLDDLVATERGAGGFGSTGLKQN